MKDQSAMTSAPHVLIDLKHMALCMTLFLCFTVLFHIPKLYPFRLRTMRITGIKRGSDNYHKQIEVIESFIQKYPKHSPKLVSASHGKTDLKSALIRIKNGTFHSFLNVDIPKVLRDYSKLVYGI
jgi:hypothetical protein